MAMQPPVIFIDECCATPDRATAAVVAYNIRKFADTYQTTFIVATNHNDLLEDLCPDVVILKHFGSQTYVFYPPQ